MKQKSILLMLSALGITFMGCQDSIESEQQIPVDGLGVFSLNIDDASSRTAINDLKVSFVSGDKLGISSGSNVNAQFNVALSTDGKSVYATPAVGNGAWNESDSVYAYYPYNESNTSVGTFTIPAEQVQTDSAASHMTNYDILVARPKVLAASKNSLTFSHATAWFELSVYNESMTEDDVIESVTIKAENKVFSTSAKMNLKANRTDADFMTFVPVDSTDEIKITASGSGWTTIKANSCVKLRLALLPVDLSAEVLTFTVKTTKGTKTVTGVAANMTAGKCYKLNIGEQYYELEPVGTKLFYIAQEQRSNDFHSNASTYSYKRCVQSDNFILFWDKEFGDNPTKFDPEAIIGYAENIYDVNINKLGFKCAGESYIDIYKMQIFILGGSSSTALATGSGYDNIIGALWAWTPGCTPETMAHEIGHSFQYQTYCDARKNGSASPSTTCGWRYGFGDGASGGCGWWEQCAQWQCYQVYPSGMFNGWYYSFPENTYLHPLHEEPRYANYFVQNYWVDKHGEDFIGYLWRNSKSPEDPFEAYMRLTGISQDEFNTEMYDYAARLQTYDMTYTKAHGGGTNIDAFSGYTKLIYAEDGVSAQINRLCAPENYGFNSIRITPPTEQTEYTAELTGMAGAEGYRNPSDTTKTRWSLDAAGWKFGFVAYESNGTRHYGNVATATGANGTAIATFTCPANCQYVWLVVMGAPTSYWRHAWNDTSIDDEQWPYKVKFSTNVQLFKAISRAPEMSYSWNSDESSYDCIAKFDISSTTYPAVTFELNLDEAYSEFGLTKAQFATKLSAGDVKVYGWNHGKNSLYSGANTASAAANGYYFDDNGNVCSWGANAGMTYLETTNFTSIVVGQHPTVTTQGVYNAGYALEYDSKMVYIKFEITVR